MSGGTACHCPEAARPVETRAWEVLDYRCNYSKFNGSRYTPSDYSLIQCRHCQALWRTKAAYVDSLR